MGIVISCLNLNNTPENPNTSGSDANGCCCFLKSFRDKCKHTFHTRRVHATESTSEGTDSAELGSAVVPESNQSDDQEDRRSSIDGYQEVHLQRLFLKSKCKEVASALNKEQQPHTMKPSSGHEDSCPTCLEGYGPDNPKIVTKCLHHYHLSCIYEWLERKPSCPVCSRVMEFSEPVESENGGD